jgi:hypothetical protein
MLCLVEFVLLLKKESQLRGSWISFAIAVELQTIVLSQYLLRKMVTLLPMLQVMMLCYVPSAE